MQRRFARRQPFAGQVGGAPEANERLGLVGITGQDRVILRESLPVAAVAGEEVAQPAAGVGAGRVEADGRRVVRLRFAEAAG